MKKYLPIIVTVGILAIFYFVNLNKGTCPFLTTSMPIIIENIKKNEQPVSINEAFRLLKSRKDNDALVIFEKILSAQPDNLDALWGRAEVLRRARDYQQAGDLLDKILSENPNHISSLISLSYIRYKDDKLNEGLKLICQVLKNNSLDKGNQALAYMMLGTINGRRSVKGWLFNKIVYGTQIKGYFLKAKELAPDLPEVRLGLGTFYLLAPAIVGGNLDEALKELELAVKLAPDFATANARLAQAYKKKGNLEKHNFYIKRAKELDPQNEVLKEIEKNAEPNNFSNIP